LLSGHVYNWKGVLGSEVLIAFLTNISDIVAELPVPHSGILIYEGDMPGLNLYAAVEIDGFNPYIITSYAAQLSIQKHLNQLHNIFYKPVNGASHCSWTLVI
jgi:hypothetical protein